MGGWRYFAERLNGDGTGTLIHQDVPLVGPVIEQSLSSPDALTASITPEAKHMKADDGRPLFDTDWSTAIYAEQDGVIRGGGILADSTFDRGTWGLTCVGFMGYWNEMPYTGPGEFFIKKDTLDITRSIIAHVQAQPGGNLGLNCTGHLSGRLVGSALASEEYDPEGGAGGLALESQAYKLAWYQNFNLLEDIHKLAEESPFDYIERHARLPDGTISHWIEFGAPTIGRRRDDLRFAIGENVHVVPQMGQDGSSYADEVFVLGAGEGAKMIRGRGFAERRGLRRVAVLTDPSIRQVGTANAAANAEVRWRSRTETLETVVVRDTDLAPLGSFDRGDEIYLSGATGWLVADDWYRILSTRIIPDASGTMELSVRRSDRLA